MPDAVLDATAVLDALLGESGGEAAREYLPGGLMSALNYSELLARAAAMCGSLGEAARRLDRLDLRVVPFDTAQAVGAASLAPVTTPVGLSLADRACLALGRARNVPVVTADRRWAGLDLGVTVICTR